MKEKFRLRCDLNEITDIEAIDSVAEAIENFPAIEPYHRYHYLFRGYHDLVHGKIDDETFFTIGDISSELPLFAQSTHTWLETIFMIEDAIKDNTLYIVESSAREYYHGKVGHDRSGAFRKDLTSHWSDLLVV